MEPRDDHDEILRARGRLHKIEGTIAALVLKVDDLTRTLNSTMAEIKPLLEDAAYQKRRRNELLARLAFTGRSAALLAAAVVVYEGVRTATGH